MPAPILDWAGRPIDQRQQRPGGGQYVYPNRGAWWNTLARDITPANIVQYIDSADRGNPSALMQLFDRMVDRDDRLQAVCETRRLALTGVDRGIVPAIAEDPRAERAAALCKEIVEQLDFEDLLDGLLDGVPKGLACFEIVWEGSRPVSLVEVPQTMLKWTDGALNIDIASGNGKAEWVPVEPNKYIVFSPRNKPGQKERRGILRSLAILWVAKHWALKDWAAFVEVFGMPLRLGVYPDGMTEDQKSELFTALQDLGSDSAAMIPETMRIEFPKAYGGGDTTEKTPMKELIDYVDKSYAIRMLGQNLTTESESGSGTLAGGAHENVRKDYLRADSKAIAAVIEKDLLRPIVGFNLGWNVPVPKMWFDTEDAQDDSARISVYVEAAKIPGMVFSKAQIREEFNFREPLDDADALVIQGDEQPSMEMLSASPRRHASIAAASMPPEFDPDSDILSAGGRASEALVRDSIQKGQDELIRVLYSFVDKLIEETSGNDEQRLTQLMRRIKLAAPDLDGALEAVGLSLDDAEEIVGQAYATSWYNGQMAVNNELEVQGGTEQET